MTFFRRADYLIGLKKIHTFVLGYFVVIYGKASRYFDFILCEKK